MIETTQTNCPNCNYPDATSGYEYRGRYSRGKRCAGCGYAETFKITVTEPQVTQRCSVKLNENLEILVVIDRTDCPNPVVKFFHKNGSGILPFEPDKVQRKILLYYATEEWRRWLKLT